MSIDLLIASRNEFDRILSDLKNVAPFEVRLDADVSIDDVVTIIAVYRNAIDNREAWWKIRREVNSRFSTHPDISTRTVALIPDNVRDEIAEFSKDEIVRIATRWSKQADATPKSEQRAAESLSVLVEACQLARSNSSGVFLRTNQPPNAFELAFSELSSKSLESYRRAFDRLDDLKKYEAHQKYNYYHKQGLPNSLALVLRDLTRRNTTKLNLKTDQRTIQKNLAKQVKAYCKSPKPTLGDLEDPIRLITLTFDVEYEGYVDIGFDTRAHALTDIQWEERTEDCLEFFQWNEGLQRFACDKLPLNVTLHDGSKVIVSPDSDVDVYDSYIGNMLRDTLIDARSACLFAKLPLAEPCYMLVGGTHTNYAWPTDCVFNSECQVQA